MNITQELAAQYRTFLSRFVKETQSRRLLVLGSSPLSNVISQVSGISYVELGHPSLIVSEPFPKAHCAVVSDGLLARLTPFEINCVVRKLMDVPYVIWAAELDANRIPVGAPQEAVGYFSLCQTAILHVASPDSPPIGILVADANAIREQGNVALVKEFLERTRSYPKRDWGGDQIPFDVPYTIEKQVGRARLTFLVANAQAKTWYDLEDSGAAQTQVDVRTDIDFIVENLLQPGDTVFDVGAHHGLYSLCFAKAVDRFGKVLAFEALPQCADIVRFNAGLNRAQNLHVHEVGLKADKSALRMFSPALAPVHDLAQYDSGFDVPAALLDEFVAEKPSFIKVNCGGYEVPVLRGAKKVLASFPNLAVRVYPAGLRAHGNTVAELVALVDWSSYTCWFVDTDGAIKPWHPSIEIAHETTIFANSNKAKFKVVMLYDDNRKNVADVSVPNIEAYCTKHGYELVKHTKLIDPALNGSWNKLKAVRQALEGADWVLWMDSDALVVDHDRTLASFVSEHCKATPFGVSTDYNGLCMGVFVIRSCPWSLQLLDTLLYLGEGHAAKMLVYDSHNRWEQNTVKCLNNYFPTVTAGLSFIPESEIQNPKSKFSSAAFIMHFWAGSGGNPELAALKMQSTVRSGWSELSL